MKITQDKPEDCVLYNLKRKADALYEKIELTTGPLRNILINQWKGLARMYNVLVTDGRETDMYQMMYDEKHEF